MWSEMYAILLKLRDECPFNPLPPSSNEALYTYWCTPHTCTYVATGCCVYDVYIYVCTHCTVLCILMYILPLYIYIAIW